MRGLKRLAEHPVAGTFQRRTTEPHVRTASLNRLGLQLVSGVEHLAQAAAQAVHLSDHELVLGTQ